MSDAFADKMNSMRKYVVSKTLKDSEATWNKTTIIRGDVATEVTRLKAEPGGDLLVAGCAQLARAVIEHGLVDEFRLMVFPIILGSGKRFFPDLSKPARLELVDVKTAGAGILLLRCKPA